MLFDSVKRNTNVRKRASERARFSPLLLERAARLINNQSEIRNANLFNGPSARREGKSNADLAGALCRRQTIGSRSFD